MKINLRSISLFLLFTISLWFFSNTGYMLFPLFVILFFSLCFSYLVMLKEAPNVNQLGLFFGVVFFYILISFLHLYILPETYLLVGLVPDLIKITMNFVLFFVFYKFLSYQKFKVLILNSLSLVIVLFLVTFFIQFFLLYVKDYHLNYLELIMGREQRITGTAGVKGIYRPSGMFNEPGSFTVFMYCIVFSRYLLNKKFDILFSLGVFSTLLTLSAQAIASFLLMVTLFIAVFSFNVLVRLKIKKDTLNLSFLFIFLIFGLFVYFIDFFYLIADYFFSRFSFVLSDGTVAVRFFAILNTFEQSGFTMLFGMGFNNSGLGYLINDTGFWFSSYSMFGLPALLFLCYVACLVYKKHGAYALIMYLLIMLSKLVVLYPIVALYFAAILSKRNSGLAYAHHSRECWT